jgi:hypothetical protein
VEFAEGNSGKVSVSNFGRLRKCLNGIFVVVHDPASGHAVSLASGYYRYSYRIRPSIPLPPHAPSAARGAPGAPAALATAPAPAALAAAPLAAAPATAAPATAAPATAAPAAPAAAAPLAAAPAELAPLQVETRYVHQLVMKYFPWEGPQPHPSTTGLPRAQQVIDHINSNRLDKRRCNLQLVSNQENLRRAKTLNFDEEIDDSQNLSPTSSSSAPSAPFIAASMLAVSAPGASPAVAAAAADAAAAIATDPSAAMDDELDEFLEGPNLDDDDFI